MASERRHQPQETRVPLPERSRGRSGAIDHGGSGPGPNDLRERDQGRRRARADLSNGQARGRGLAWRDRSRSCLRLGHLCQGDQSELRRGAGPPRPQAEGQVRGTGTPPPWADAEAGRPLSRKMRYVRSLPPARFPGRGVILRGPASAWRSRGPAGRTSGCSPHPRGQNGPGHPLRACP